MRLLVPLLMMKPRARLGASRVLAMSQRAMASNAMPVVDLDLLRVKNAHNNIPESIIEKVGRNLHHNPDHPLGIIKNKIEDYFNQYATENKQTPFLIVDNMNPIVSTTQCFDELCVGPDHVSRRPSDTYYVNENEVLRTHTSAHQTTLMAQGKDAFLVSGDVYRRDQIDASHFPVFHQMEGVRVFPNELLEGMTEEERVEYVKRDLQNILSGLAKHLFGPVETRWNEDYFPFTHPSFELEVLYQGNWLEVLGCGVIHPKVLEFAEKRALMIEDGDKSIKPTTQVGWAFGLGLERLAMVLFNIPDIRLFWSSDERFTKQFKAGQTTEFQPFSKYPGCYKDVSFWLPPADANGKEVHPHDVYEVIQSLAGELVENVTIIDEFTHPKTGKKSQAFRIMYRSMSRSLTNQEVDELQFRVRDELVKLLKVELR